MCTTVMNRAVLALVTGVVGSMFGLLMADTVWALTVGLPTFLRYAAGGVIAIVVGLWIGDTALYLEAHSDG